MRLARRVRKDATISLGGALWEVATHLRVVINVHFDPIQWTRVEVCWVIASSATRLVATNTSTLNCLPATTMNAISEVPALELALKTLWGASRWRALPTAPW